MHSRLELAQYFNKLGFKKGAEVGVADGIYSEKLCKAIPGLELFCIDPWETYSDNRRGGGVQQQHDNFEKAKQKLLPFKTHFLRMFSMDAVRQFEDESLDFVFIDGNHDFDFVMEDLIAWSRKVRKGGIISGHDYYHFHNSGVIEAVNAFTEANRIDLQLTDWNNLEYRDDRPPCFWWIKK